MKIITALAFLTIGAFADDRLIRLAIGEQGPDGYWRQGDSTDNSGYLQMKTHFGEWKTVNYEGFGAEELAVACHQLGYARTGSHTMSDASLAPGVFKQDEFVDNVSCNPGAERLQDCSYDFNGSSGRYSIEITCDGTANKIDGACTDDCAYAFGRCVNMKPEDSYNECVKSLNDGDDYQMNLAGCVKGCTLIDEMTKWSENQPCLTLAIIGNNSTESAKKTCVFPFIYQAGNTASMLPGRRCQAASPTRGWCYTNQASTEWGYCDSNCFIEGYADNSFIVPSGSSEYLILLALTICFIVLF